ncbi:Uncharacterised protein [Achromobacter denitrificans]|nr:Uncharacterised protein [Achromobacter denitrificans]
MSEEQDLLTTAGLEVKPVRTPARPAFMLLGAAMLTILAACGDERAALTPNLTAAALPERADAVRGRQWIADYGCLACHAVPTVRGPASSVGPPWATWGGKPT